MSRTWKLTVDENELKALISYHVMMHGITRNGDISYQIERSHRIHDLTKRLNKKDEPEIEKESEPTADNDVKETSVPSVWG